MPRKFFQRYMPDYDKIRNHKQLRCLGRWIHKSALWNLNRRSVATAVAIGLFISFMPAPFHMVMAAFGAVYFNGNLPISVAMVWVNNPLTMPPVFYVAYLVGSWLLRSPPGDFHFELSLNWLLHGMAAVWAPLLVGCLVLGLASATMGYIGMRLTWRFMVLHRWRRRHMQRAAA